MKNNNRKGGAGHAPRYTVVSTAHVGSWFWGRRCHALPPAGSAGRRRSRSFSSRSWD